MEYKVVVTSDAEEDLDRFINKALENGIGTKLNLWDEPYMK